MKQEDNRGSKTVSIRSSVKNEPEDDSDLLEKNQIAGGTCEEIKKEEAMVAGSDKWLRQCFEMKEEQEEEKPFLPDIHRMSGSHATDRTDVQSTNLRSPPHSKRLLSKKRTPKEKTNQSAPSLKTNYELKLKEGTLSADIVGNLCTLKCPVCLKTFNCLNTFYQHNIRDLARKKKCSIQSTRKHLHKYLLKVITHKCKICSKLLLCDRNTILKHTSYVHDIRTLTEYASKTGCTQKTDLIPSDASVSENADSGLCKYKCDRCCATFLKWTNISAQMRNKHDSKVRRANILSYLDTITVYNCKL